jgi:hypothetical protein
MYKFTRFRRRSKTTPTAPVVNVVNNCDGTSTLTASEYTGFMGTGESTASITVQTAATYTVTTNASGCTSLQGSGVAAPKTTPTAPVVNVVNNCDGTSINNISYRNFIMEY